MSESVSLNPLSERIVAKQIKDEYENLMKLVRYTKSNKSKKYDWRGKAASLNQ